MATVTTQDVRSLARAGAGRILGRCAVLVLAGALAGTAPAADPANPTDPGGPTGPTGPAAAAPPIRRIVLYKHGVGYFERQGTVSGDATLELHFREFEMSDVLKTLTALDLGGGRIEAVGYDSQKPPERILQDFAFSLSAQDTQLNLLRQLRGARVAVSVAGIGDLTGSVLGVDTRNVGEGNTAVTRPVLALLTDGGSVKSFDLFDVRSLTFTDPALAADLERYLDTLRSTHHKEERALRLRSAGEGERDVFIAYAIEQPVWKATYRIILDGQEPLLQGWAVVDNASDEDWTDVRLSLVAGLPISFRQDLYTPRYVERPSVEETGGQPLGVEAERDRRRIEAKKSRSMADAPARGAAESLDDKLSDARQQQIAEAVTRDIGDLLEYTIDHPVTILRNRSALLPIVATRVKGGRVAWYDKSRRPDNPLAAVRIENTSGLSLERGPAMVLADETYAGEAQIGPLKPGEVSYVPFAVDLGVKAESALDSRSERVHAVSIAKGVMVQRYDQVDTTTYGFDNKNAEPRTIVVEHPRREGFDLRAPAEPFESELGSYRFKVEAAAQERATLVVKESRELSTTVAIANIGEDALVLLSQRGILSPAAEQALRDLIVKRNHVAALQTALSDARTALADIDGDQARVRKNLEALGQTDAEKDLRRTYVDQMKEDEARVHTLRARVTELTAEINAAQAEVDAAIQDFALDYTLP